MRSIEASIEFAMWMLVIHPPENRMVLIKSTFRKIFICLKI